MLLARLCAPGFISLFLLPSPRPADSVAQTTAPPVSQITLT